MGTRAVSRQSQGNCSEIFSGFPNDFKVTNYSILLFFVSQKTGMINVEKISLNAPGRLLNVLKIILKPLLAPFAHTALA